MSRRTRRLFRSTQDKETKFIACLLANGPRPTDPADFQLPPGDYRTRIMAWWKATHTSESVITSKTCHRFYIRYTRWLAQQSSRRVT